ncbi:MAG: GTPase Era [Eubacterium sp.]
MEQKFKSGFVTLVGRPNVGKSTLMNRIIGQKIAITSNKPQTTRNRIQTVYHDDRGQIVFLDTPGIHKAKNKLGEFMVNAAESTFKEVDLVLWLVEATTYIGQGERHIAQELKKSSAPVILVMNKIDKVRKDELLECMNAYKDILDFAEMVPVSAQNGENVDDLIETMFSYLEEGPQFYDEDTITDQPVRQIVAELIREKALRLLQDEIPHGIAVSTQHEERPGKIFYDIDATIVARDSTRALSSETGCHVEAHGTAARKEIEDFLRQKSTQLWVG